MRGRWERRLPYRVHAVYGYVEGVADSEGYQDVDYWSEVCFAFQAYWDKTGNEVGLSTWMSELSAIAPAQDCEVPMLYAALDYYRGVCADYSMVWQITKEWAASFEREQETRFGGPLPVPSMLKFVAVNKKCFRILYLDHLDRPYYEVTRQSKEALMSWASSSLRVPNGSWEPLEQ